MADKVEVGKIEHYFDKIDVAVIQVTGNIKVGDKLLFEGATTSFEQPVESMQVEHNTVESAKPGDDIGMKVNEKVRKGDKVYKI